MAGIYLHVPFCKTRCIYCDFYSTSDQSAWKKQYIEALCKELEMRKSYLQGEPIETIYFGGGTPSQLLPEDFNQIFETIQSIYGIAHCQEITLEANPDDLTIDYIKKLSQLPFNRLSIGVQTFDDRLLKLLHRRHSGKQALLSVEECRKQGFENISIDLMYGLPGETLNDWDQDLTQAINLHVDHISAYHLIYEEGTSLWQLRQQHRIEEASEDASVQFFAHIRQRLSESGYIHYEISNFCRPEMFSMHNSNYWKGRSYLGCGPSAHSYDGISRQWNAPSLHQYIKGMEINSFEVEKEELNLNTQYNEFVIISLRTMWGLSLEKLKAQFGTKLHAHFLKNARKHLDSGKLIIKEQTLYFSQEGLFVSDGIMSDLLWID